VSAADGAISDAEADLIFAEFADQPALILAVSGGPDSTALLVLAARWHHRHRLPMRIVAVTVDHGLRREARREAAAVKRLAANLGVAHRTLRWIGPKPATGLQEKARAARYWLLYKAARAAKARFVLTAHTLDDQAETVLLRLLRGSGVAGIGGMARLVQLCDLLAPDPRIALSRGLNGAAQPRDITAVSLVRPFLGVAKSRLIATLREAGSAYAEDPSNRDPRFTRARLRRLMPALAAEGLTPDRLDRLAHRVRRGEAALEALTDAAAERLGYGADSRRIVLPARDWGELPGEIALRLLGRAIVRVGDEGPVELRKLETLHDALTAALAGGAARFRRTLAGAMVSLQKGAILIERAPPRQHPTSRAASASRVRQ
jgi:tRNA(Ile)-lysidine synthase